MPPNKKTELKVFLSYSQRNQDLAYAIMLSTKDQISKKPEFNYELKFLYDEDRFIEGDNIYEGILNALDEADCILAILTEDSLQSPYVIEELTRAHDRRLEIIAILENENLKDKVPWFLKDTKFILKKDLTSFQIAKNVVEVLKSYDTRINPSSLQGITSNLSQIVKEINSSKDNLYKGFKIKLAENLLTQVDREIRSLQTSTYEIAISEEQNFLLRAGPVFGLSKRVYSTSVEKISTFWTNKQCRQEAKQYIKYQPKNTFRLFVFDSPKKMHAYGNILNDHYDSYGEEGGVYVTTSDNYEKLVGSFCNSKSKIKNLSDIDFGILCFEEKTQNDSPTKFVEAHLNGKELFLYEKDNKKNRLVNEKNLVSFFEKLSEIEPGKMSKDNKIIRWKKNLFSDHMLWNDYLRKLFKQITGEVIHCVYFHKEAKKYFSVNDLINYKDKLYQHLNENYSGKFLGIHVGSNIMLNAKDGKYGGELTMSSDYVYALHIKFKDEQTLAKYYTDIIHSNIRQEIYSIICSNTEKIYNVLNNNKIDEEEKRILFQNIERAIAHSLKRCDFIETQAIESIIKMPPIDF